MSAISIFVTSLLILIHSVVSNVHHKYCVIGAGPSGLQLGHFFQRNDRDYIVFEKGSSPGTFFETYPRHDTLISINKIYTGLKNTEFNLRHDWNSILADDPEIKFSKFTRDLFPHRKFLLQYLAEYQSKLKIKVRFNTTISNIRKENEKFVMHDQHLEEYSCSVLILATGIATPHIPHFGGVQHTIGYEDMSLNPEDYAGKSVLIIGKGNAAFETAAHIYGHTNLIHMVSRERLRLAWATHYVGDLRAVNNALLDTYQLKSLDGLFESDIRTAYLHKMATGEMALLSGAGEAVNARLKSQGYLYDVVIRCTGWKFDFAIFNKTSLSQTMLKGRKRKYPKIKGDYQSSDTKDMYVAGTASHSLDWRKSAGGFIHGFRYTARALSRILEWRYERVPWSRETFLISGLVDHFTRRANEASGTYQMFATLVDVAIVSKNHSSYQFVEEFPVGMIHSLSEMTGIQVEGPIFVLALEYGKNFSGPGKDPFNEDRAGANVPNAYESNFLHPVYYYFKTLPSEKDMIDLKDDILPRPDSLHHTIEDFFTNFRDRKNHVLPLQRFVEYSLDQDISVYSAERCLSLALVSRHLPRGCGNNPTNHVVSTDFLINSW